MTTEPVAVPRWRREGLGLRSRFRLLWIAPLLAFLALGGWAFASPLGSAPDDDFHLSSIWCAGSSPESTCAVDEATGQRSVPVAVLRAPCFAYNPELTAACQAQFLADPDQRAFTDRGNFFHNYPPVFYAVMGLFASDHYEVSAVVMRFVNIALFLALTTALYLALPRLRRPSLVWGWLISTVPLGLFLIASNNPSSWAIIGVGSAWLALLGYVETVGRRRILLGALFVLSSLMAAGARGDGAIYIVLSIAIVGVLTVRPDRRFLLQAILPALVALGAIALYYSSQQSGVAVAGLGVSEGVAGTPSAELSSFALLAYNLLYVPSLWAGIFTGAGWTLGWLDTEMPSVVFVGAFLVFGGLVFAGLRYTNVRKTIALVIMALVVWLLPTYVLVAGHNVVGENVQPRYILPLFVLLAGVAVLSVGDRVLTLSRLQGWFVVLALGIAQSMALHANLRRYVNGADSTGVNLDANIDWWWAIPISPMAVWIVGSLAFAGLAGVLVREMVKPRAVEV